MARASTRLCFSDEGGETERVVEPGLGDDGWPVTSVEGAQVSLFPEAERGTDGS